MRLISSWAIWESNNQIGILGFSCYLGYMEVKVKTPQQTLSIICGTWPFFSLYTEKNYLELKFVIKSTLHKFAVQGWFQVINEDIIQTGKEKQKNYHC